MTGGAPLPPRGAWAAWTWGEKEGEDCFPQCLRPELTRPISPNHSLSDKGDIREASEKEEPPRPQVGTTTGLPGPAERGAGPGSQRRCPQAEGACRASRELPKAPPKHNPGQQKAQPLSPPFGGVGWHRLRPDSRVALEGGRAPLRPALPVCKAVSEVKGDLCPAARLRWPRQVTPKKMGP